MARFIELKYISGLAVTVEVVVPGTNVITETIVFTERTIAKTHYVGTIIAGANSYDLAIKVGANYVGTDEVVVGSVDGTTYFARSLLNVDAIVANRIADHVLRRKFANARVSADGDIIVGAGILSNGRSLLGAASKLANRFAPLAPPSENQLIVYQEDDTTQFWSQTVNTDALAIPITGVDTN